MVDAGEPIQKGGELNELVVAVVPTHEFADLPRMRLRGLPELRATGFRQRGVADAPIARALLASDETVALEAVQEPCHTAGG